MAYEYSEFFEGSHELKKTLYCDQLFAILAPNEPYYFLRLAKTYAKTNDIYHTVSNLKNAFDLGFKDVDYINSEEVFNKFKGKKKFDKFLISINENSN